MRMFQSIARFVHRVRLESAERELAFLEALAPEALARHRENVERLRAKYDGAPKTSEQIRWEIERRAKKAGVLA